MKLRISIWSIVAIISFIELLLATVSHSMLMQGMALLCFILSIWRLGISIVTYTWIKEAGRLVDELDEAVFKYITELERIDSISLN